MIESSIEVMNTQQFPPIQVFQGTSFCEDVLVALIGGLITLGITILTYNFFEKKKSDRDERAQRKRDANELFFSLLELFNMRKEDAIESINRLHDFAIKRSDKESTSFFLNNYGIIDVNIPVDGSGLNIQTGSYLKGPLFKEKKVIELSEIASQNNVSYILNVQFKSVYGTTGPYFKVFHRIIKLLNQWLEDKTIDLKTYNQYIGILRTQIEAKEFIVILINSLFVKRGLGLGVQLVGTGFFGDDKDFKIEQHFDIPNEKDILSLLNQFELNSDNIKKRKRLEEKLTSLDKEEIFSFEDFVQFSKEKEVQIPQENKDRI